MFCLFLEVHIAVDVVISGSNMSVFTLSRIGTWAYICFDELVDCGQDVLVTCYIVQSVWSVLFDPEGEKDVLDASKKMLHAPGICNIPWQTVFKLYRQIGSTSLAF